MVCVCDGVAPVFLYVHPILSLIAFCPSQTLEFVINCKINNLITYRLLGFQSHLAAVYV